VSCVNGFSWCGNTSGRGYCSDECRGDRALADETRRIDVALKEYDRRTADKPGAGRMCKPWCDTFASAYPVKSYCSDECKAAGRSINEKDKPEAGRTCCDLHGMTGKDDNRCLWILPNGDATDVTPAARPEPAGLYRKFTVERTNGSSGPGGKHEHCDYFVLDWAHDKFAVAATLAYAKACEAEYPDLARDLRERAGMAVAHAEPARKVPMNPVPRSVDTFAPLPDDEFRRAIRDGEEAGRRAMRRQALDEGRPPPIESPLPVERCSCDDARTMAVLKELMPNAAGAAEKIAALRQALKEIAQIPQGSQGAYGKFARASNIARRALALGGEE